jgi:hypothetical protein
VRRLIPLLFFVGIPILVVKAALACSCCADPGDWRRFNRPLSTGEMAAMEGANYSGTLRLEQLDRQDREFEDMTVRAELHDARFTLGANEHRELIRLTLPDSCDVFQSDTGGGGTQVILYKERTFDCAVEFVDPRLSRYLASRATLVLQGHGNRCFTLTDLERWIVKFEERPGTEYQSHHRAYGVVDTKSVPSDWHKKR